MNQSCFYPVSKKLGLAANISAGILNEFQVGTDDDTSGTPGLCGDPFLMEEWIDGGTNYKDMACEPQVPLPSHYLLEYIIMQQNACIQLSLLPLLLIS